MLENIGDSLIVIHKSISIETGRISESITMRVTPVLTVVVSYSFVGKEFKQEAARKSLDNV